MRLRIRALGLTLGTFVGVVFLLAVLYSSFIGQGITYNQIRPIFGLMVTRTVIGAFIALFWGFLYGFITGAVVAWLYNFFHKVLYKSTPAN